MSQEKYQQICLDVEGMRVILEFPSEEESIHENQKRSSQEEEARQIKKEIKEIFLSELLEKIKQSYGF